MCFLAGARNLLAILNYKLTAMNLSAGEELRRLLLKHFKLSTASSPDCEYISITIFQQTGNYLSRSTLTRLLVTDNNSIYRPTPFVQKVICEFIDGFPEDDNSPG